MSERGGYPSSSSLHRIAVCRGSWLAEQEVRESSFGADWRDEGSELHDLAEEEQLGGLTDEQRWALKEAWRLRDQFYEDYGIGGRKLTEQRLWAHSPSLTPLFSGQFDEARISDDYAVCVDYKFGRIPVPPADENMQIASYCVLLWLNFPNRKLYGGSIVQPRLPQEERFSVVVYEEDEMQNLYDFFRAIIEAAREPHQPRTPSYHACEYCRALPCPQAWNYFTKV